MLDKFLESHFFHPLIPYRVKLYLSSLTGTEGQALFLPFGQHFGAGEWMEPEKAKRWKIQIPTFQKL